MDSLIGFLLSAVLSLLGTLEEAQPPAGASTHETPPPASTDDEPLLPGQVEIGTGSCLDRGDCPEDSGDPENFAGRSADEPEGYGSAPTEPSE